MKNKLTEIINRAKKLRKDFPNKFSKWTDYVKAAAKEKASRGVKAVKKAAKKKIKKTLIKASRSHFLKGTDVERTHKDVKSHNLKINFFSGMNEKLNFNEKVGIIYAHMKIVQDKIIARQKLTPYEEKLFKYISSYGFHNGSKKAVRDKIIK